MIFEVVLVLWRIVSTVVAPAMQKIQCALI